MEGYASGYAFLAFPRLKDDRCCVHKDRVATEVELEADAKCTRKPPHSVASGRNMRKTTLKAFFEGFLGRHSISHGRIEAGC